MRSTTLAFALALLAPLAAADETHPDCEPTQPWLGYRSTLAPERTYDGAGAPGGLEPCEGEHWDGQDPTGAPLVDCMVCLGEDPNRAPGDNVLQPAGARASRSDEGAVYVAANVALVARGALYADEGTVAVYYRDNTPANLVWNLQFLLRITGPPTSEADCDQQQYQEERMIGHPPCGRDNTALTLQHALLP